MRTKILFLVFLFVKAGFALAQLPSTLYIVGNAAPIGWHIENAMALQTTSSGVYQYSGPLFAGNYKFAVNQNSCWCQDFYLKDANDPTKVVKNGTDNQWTISTLGQYNVTVNLNTMSINVQNISSTPVYKNFWIIGDATPAGWTMDNVINQKFSVNPNNTTEYYYQGNFTAGEFKIFMGAFNDFSGSFYMPMSNHQSFSSLSAQAVNNPSFDYKWQITTPGNYTVILNPSNNTVKVTSGITLAVNNFNDKKRMTYPNPSKGIVFFQLNNSFEGKTAEIYNMGGQKIMDVKIINNQINLEKIQSGNYVVKIDGDNQNYLEKIIIAK